MLCPAGLAQDIGSASSPATSQNAPTAIHNILLVKFSDADPSRQQAIEHIDGVTAVTVLLDSIYKIQCDSPDARQRVRTLLSHFDGLVSVSEDHPLYFDDRRGTAVPTGRTAATSPSGSKHAAFSKLRVRPNDPEFANQWYLDNTGQYGATPGLDLNAPEAWQLTTGPEDSIVAVFGTGVDYTHEDLAGSLWTNPGEIPGNRIDDDGNGYIDDVYGVNTARHDGDPRDEHGMGTSVAGIIAAQTNNGLGISGISWSSKILSCSYYKKVGTIFVGFLSDVLECFDYVVRLKKKTNANITSVLFPDGGPGYRFVLRDAAEALDSLGILLIIAGPMYTEPLNEDVVTEFPLGFDLPNTIGVEPLSRQSSFNFSPLFLPYARRSIHTIAFGDFLLTTFPGYTPDLDGAAIYFEGFEPGTTWQVEPPWTLSGSESFEGTQSAAMVLGNESLDKVYLTSPVIDLSQYAGQRLGVTLKVKAPETYTHINGYLASTGRVRVYVGWPGVFAWKVLDGLSEESQGWRNVYFDFGSWLWDQIPDPTQVQFRIEFGRGAEEPLELYVDNFALGLPPKQTPGSNNYAYYSGSIAAAAVVAGAAELIKGANPTATAGQIKNAIMSTGFPPNVYDPAGDNEMTSLNNTALQLWDASGNGAVNCAGYGFTRRTWPKTHIYEIAATGQQKRLRAVSTNCGAPGTAPLLQPDDGGTAVILKDDGKGLDRHAKDGDFAGTWSRTTPGTTTLALSGDTDLQIAALDSYDQVTSIPFEWRDMTDADSGPVLPAPPFALRIGNHPAGFKDDIRVFSINGTIRMMHIGMGASNSTARSLGEVVSWNNRGSLSAAGIPAGVDSFLISLLAAPNLSDPLAVGGPFYFLVSGVAPNREWIIEFRDLTFKDCPADQNLRAQIIFFEDSSNIQMNFAEYAPGCGDETRMPGVGIQYNDLAFTRYAGPIGDKTSLLFSASAYSGNHSPVANTDTISAVVHHGTTLNIDLSQYFSDPDGDPLTYWLTASPDGVSIDGNTLSANLDFSTTETGFVEDYVYASDGTLAAKANLHLSFENSSNFPPRPIAPLPIPVFYLGESAAFPLQELFFDPEGDPITFDSASLPVGFDLWSNGTLHGAGYSTLPLGLNEIRFRVNDGNHWNDISMTIDLHAARGNLPPQLVTPIGTVNVEVGKMFRVALDDHFRDPNGDPLSFSYAAPYPPFSMPMTNIPEHLLGGVPESAWLVGSPHTIHLRIQDNHGAFITHDFQIAVSNPAAMAATESSAPGEQSAASAGTPGNSKSSAGGSADFWLLAMLFASACCAAVRSSRRRQTAVSAK